jgi:hypothetical protein
MPRGGGDRQRPPETVPDQKGFQVELGVNFR